MDEVKEKLDSILSANPGLYVAVSSDLTQAYSHETLDGARRHAIAEGVACPIVLYSGKTDPTSALATVKNGPAFDSVRGMVEFADPFHTLLQAFADQFPQRSVRVQFATPEDEPEFKEGAKGFTWFPASEEEGPPIITIDVSLDRGVRGTLDILAHELAHVAVGPEHEHDEKFDEVYDGFLALFEREGLRVRTIIGGE